MILSSFCFMRKKGIRIQLAQLKFEYSFFIFHFSLLITRSIFFSVKKWHTFLLYYSFFFYLTTREYYYHDHFVFCCQSWTFFFLFGYIIVNLLVQMVWWMHASRLQSIVLTCSNKHTGLVMLTCKHVAQIHRYSRQLL
jgi:hypothetical protein